MQEAGGRGREADADAHDGNRIGPRPYAASGDRRREHLLRGRPRQRAGPHAGHRRGRGPTYQLANPLDDLEMGITHVIRGEDLPARARARLGRVRLVPLRPALRGGHPRPRYALSARPPARPLTR
ncbi:MAG: glutamate--tRNA ligase family protein, partial [Actinomycetota bacterium]